MIIEILLIVLTIAFATVAIIKAFRRENKISLTFGALTVLLIVFQAFPVESFKWWGLEMEVQGPRTRDVSISIGALPEGVRPDQVSVFLVPNEYQARPTRNEKGGQRTMYSFQNIPEGNYQVVLAASVRNRRHYLMAPRSVSGPELDPIERFPAEATAKGIVTRMGAEVRFATPVVIGNQVEWSDDDGHFEISGLDRGGRYDLSVLDRTISKKQVTVSEFETNMGTVYAPEPVADARICEEIAIISRKGRDEWLCLGQVDDRLPPTVTTVWFLTHIRAAPHTQVIHRWRHGDDVTDVPLKVGLDDFRTKSSKLITKRGQWTVEVLDPSGKVLTSKSFRVDPG